MILNMLRHTILTLALACGASAWALEITSAPGKLAALAGSEAATATELTVKGAVDASDLFFIADEMPALTRLDLGEVVIEAYQGQALKGNETYAAATVPAMCFAGSRIADVVFPRQEGLVIADGAFAAAAITSVAISAAKATLGVGAFAACPALVAAAVAPSAKFEGYVFRDCKALESVDILGGNALGAYDFAGCSALVAVAGTVNLTVIPEACFQNCTALADFEFSDKLTAIGPRAFQDTALAAAKLSSPLKSVGAWAFAGCADLVDVELPASVATLGEGAFFECPELTHFTLPAACTVVPAYLHKDNAALATLDIPAGTAAIGEYALKGAGVDTLTLPESLASIGTGAMADASKLSGINARELRAVPALGNDVWEGVDQKLVTLNVDQKLLDDFRSAPQWQEFDIQSIETGIVDAPLVSAIVVRGAYTPRALMIETGGDIIDRLEVFDLDGRLLLSRAVGADSAVFDAFDTDIVLVRCYLEGHVATLKLARL